MEVSCLEVVILQGQTEQMQVTGGQQSIVQPGERDFCMDLFIVYSFILELTHTCSFTHSFISLS